MEGLLRATWGLSVTAASVNLCVSCADVLTGERPAGKPPHSFSSSSLWGHPDPGRCFGLTSPQHGAHQSPVRRRPQRHPDHPPPHAWQSKQAHTESDEQMQGICSSNTSLTCLWSFERRVGLGLINLQPSDTSSATVQECVLSTCSSLYSKLRQIHIHIRDAQKSHQVYICCILSWHPLSLWKMKLETCKASSYLLGAIPSFLPDSLWVLQRLPGNKTALRTEGLDSGS